MNMETVVPIAEIQASPEGAPTRPNVYVSFVEACAAKAAFLEHFKRTHQPETFPGLSHIKPPSKNSPFLLVVDEFSVDPSKRPDGELIPCAACATKKKFRRGSLAWYPEEGVLRVVGNECGDFRRVEAVAEYNRRTTLAVLNDHLLDQLPGVPALIQRAVNLRPVAHHAQALSLQLKTQAKSFCDTVLNALKDGEGQLTIYLSEVEENATDSRRIAFCRPEGTDFLRAMFQPLRRVDEALLRLREADRGDEEAAFSWQDEHSEDLPSLDGCYANLRAGTEKLNEAERLIAAAITFLSEDNLRKIDSWSFESGNPQLRARWGLGYINFTGPAKRVGAAQQATALRPDWELLGGLGVARPA